MRKVALVYVLAVFLPSLLLAWLAVRSLRDQQFVLERQRSLLYQGVTDALAGQVNSMLAERQHAFGLQVEEMLGRHSAAEIAPSFDQLLRTNWLPAEVGFVVTTAGDILAPSPLQTAEGRLFLSCNGMFLANRESAEVYWNPARQIANTLVKEVKDIGTLNETVADFQLPTQTQVLLTNNVDLTRNLNDNTLGTGSLANNQAETLINNDSSGLNRYPQKSSFRKVSPQQQTTANTRNSSSGNQGFFNYDPDQNRSQSKSGSSVNPAGQQKAEAAPPDANSFKPRLEEPPPAPPQRAEVVVDPQLSKVAPAETEFRQLIGDANEGTLARFVNNRLNVLFWYRSSHDPRYIFGAQLALPRLIGELKALAETLEPTLREEVCVAVLDDTARPVALSRPEFLANWKRPIVATEIGEALPHWEVAAYALNPGTLDQAARTARLTLSLLIGVLLLAIGVGSWLIVRDLNRQLTLARQKTDFVSNVSHELKTPLTSIRMFSELLADDRVADPAKQRSYLSIITAEAARLTRLINNVLDFSRMERGEKKYNFQQCDLLGVVRDSAESYRLHLENNGFKLDCTLPDGTLPVRGDGDALAQIVVNLLSNAEKYSKDQKEIIIQAGQRDGPLPCAEVRVLDRGLGVPRGSEEKIFEKFYRAHDSLSSGIQGSGLGLTLARQIARAHGGDVVCEAREGGGTCFCLRLPLVQS